MCIEFTEKSHLRCIRMPKLHKRNIKTNPTHHQLPYLARETTMAIHTKEAKENK